jgi:LAS superfamily LD-carboxypeptidase LdcB
MNTKQNYYQRTYRGGRLLAFALFIMLLAGCAAPAAAPSETPALSAVPTPNAAASVTPASTLEPIATTAPDVIPSAAPSPTPSPLPLPKPQPPAAKAIGQLVCTADKSVNIRGTVGKSGDVVGVLPGGATADVLAYESSWAHISYNGVTGYVSRDYTIPRHQPDIDVPSGDWASILVNTKSLLPDGFSVDVADFSGGQVDKRILKICKAMFADAKADGVTLKLVDAYRSYGLQKKLYEEKVNSYIAKGYSRKDAEAEAATITARPNTSEHQTGLALDIVTPSYTRRDKGFANTDAFKWLNANAQDYGFTLRYKKGKQGPTGVIYEPWHWRFVGVKAARAMKKSGEVLEEYFG